MKGHGKTPFDEGNETAYEPIKGFGLRSSHVILSSAVINGRFLCVLADAQPATLERSNALPRPLSSEEPSLPRIGSIQNHSEPV